MELRLSRTLAEAIQSETEAASPQECCGLLIGDPAALTVTAILPAANIAGDPLHRFEIDPATLLAAHKAARAGGPQILGYYHSHPLGDPVPSSVDAAMAEGGGAIWLIVGRRGEMRAWLAASQGSVHGRFSPVGIALEGHSDLAPAAASRH